MISSSHYNTIHHQIRKVKVKPAICPKCKKEKKLELSNKDHTYKKELSNWQWLCRGCHFLYDYKTGLRKVPRFKKVNSKYKRDIKLLNDAGISIRKLSINYNIPYATLYWELKKKKADKSKK